MNFSSIRYRKRIYSTACIFLIICFFTGWNQGFSETKEMRNEDRIYFDTTGASTAYAFSNKYMLSARGTQLVDWTPTQFSIVLTDIVSGKVSEIETISAVEIHLFSDGNLFYVVAAKKGDECDFKNILQVGIYESDKEKIDWHEPINIETDCLISDEVSDVVLINKNIFLIFTNHVVAYNTDDKMYKCIFCAEKQIVNQYFLNHVCVYENELFLQDATGAIFALNADDGSYRNLGIRSKVYRPGKYDEELGKYKYYIYGSNLIYLEAYGHFEQMVAYNIITQEYRVIFDGSFSVYFHDENGIYIDLMDYGTGKYLFSPNTNELEIISKKEFQPLEKIKYAAP